MTVIVWIDMPLAAGDRLGSYEVIALLGAGGMGEVYRARDRKLDRDVALKVLSASLSQDTDYLARFQREAQVLASLNHPNIAQIYGLEEGAIVMELVDGETLEQRIARGALPLDEALPIARQIAEALEAAHDRAIIHRDLKPANIKITPAGAVKVLDFGLAKAAEPASAASSANSPTLTIGATQVGTIMGTAGYMAPEQAAAKPVDKRADIWAFGVILHEMLSGKQLFNGETISHTLASVLKDSISFDHLPAPPPIRDLVSRCLDRDPRTRLRDAGEARIAIQRFLAHPAPVVQPPQAPPRSHWLPWTIAAAAVIAAMGIAIVTLPSTHSTPSQPLRFTAELAPGITLHDSVTGPTSYASPNVVISPDGLRLAFVGSHSGESLKLYSQAGSNRRDCSPLERGRQRPGLFAGWPLDRLLCCRQTQEGLYGWLRTARSVRHSRAHGDRLV